MKRLLAIALVLSLASPSYAELINIDSNSLGLVPSAVYGAASGQAGVWNGYAGGGIASAPLLDINGLLTDVTVTTTAGVYSSATHGYTGDQAELMNDVFDSASSITIANLDAGSYTIYTYASDPDVPTTAGTIITIGGVSEEVIGPPIAGGVFIENTHYALHSVVHPGGDLVITVADLPGGNGFWNVNGIQIVPEPTSLALLALGGVALIRRRR